MIRKAMWVECDACGQEVGSSDYGCTDAVSARHAARQEGAHRSRGRDICEDCWKQGER